MIGYDRGFDRMRVPPEDAGGLVQLATRIPLSLRKRLTLYCVQQDRRISSFVVEALAEHLAKRQGGAT